MESYNTFLKCLWARCFVEEQGYAVGELKFHQDNIISMLIENNGKESSMKQTNHILVQYLFIKYCVDTGDLYLKYCLSGEMYADLFTKTLQGATLWRLWDMIQVIPEITLDVDSRCPRAMAKFTSQ